MASSGKSTSRSIFLDTTAAQTAVDRLAGRVSSLDKQLENTNLSQKKRDQLSKQRMDAEAQRLKVLEQINQGLGATYSQQSKYVQDLTRDVKKLAVGTDEWKQKLDQLKTANATLSEMKDKMGMVNKAQDQAGGGFAKITKGIATVTAAAAGLKVLVDFLHSSVEEAEQAERANSRLKNILSNIGREDAFDRLSASADKLAKSVGYLDNDDVIESFQQLVTYGKLTEGQIQELTPVIVDFAAKSGLSMQEATSVMIKGLEGNSKALKEYGINMKEGGSVTERMNIIMTDLKPRVEGAAEAFGETMAGQAAKAKQKLADVKEEIGNKLMPVLTKLYSGASQAITYFSKSIEVIGQVFQYGISQTIAMQTAQAAKDGREAANAQAVDGIIEAYKKTREGKIRSNADIIKALKDSLAFDEEQMNDAVAKGQAKREGMYKQDIENTKAAIAKIGGMAGSGAAGDKLLGLGGDMGGGGDGGAAAKKQAEKLKQAQDELKKLMADVQKDVDKGSMSELWFKIAEIEKEANQRLETALELAKKTGMGKEELQKLQANILLAKKEALEELVGSTAPVPITAEFVIPEPTPEDEAKVKESMKKFSERLARDNKAGLELDTLTGTAGSRLKAKQDLLELEKQQELSNKDLTENEKLLIEEKYRQKSSDLAQQFRESELGKVQEYLGYLNQAMNILEQFSQAKSAREKADFEKEIKHNNERRKSIEKMHKSGVISELQAKQQIAAIDQEEAKKKEELDKKAHERQKKFAIAQAIINGAMAVTKILAETPKFDFGIATAIQIGLAVATTAAQIATISSQKFAKGGRLTGPSHSAGGMPVINPVTGAKEAEVEGGEYILSKRTVQNNRPLADALLYASMNRNGEAIRPAYMNRSYQAINYPAINRSYGRRYFAEGGEFKSTNNPGNSAASQQTQVVVQRDEQLSSVMNAILFQLQNPVAPEISLKKIEDKQSQKARILDDATFR